MQFWMTLVIVFVSFCLGALFEWVYMEFRNPEVGILDIDDETNPNKILWQLKLNQKIPPEEIWKKDYVKFLVLHNGR